MTALIALALTASAGDLNIPFERYQLDNGLDVVLAPDPSAPIVQVNVWYHVGSKDEQPGLTGFAHLFEHLMFQGSPNNPGEYFTPLQEVGARINGTTNTDRTNYFETVPSRYLPLALFLESDRMGWLMDQLDQTMLDNQRDVVRNERRQNYELRPYGQARQLLAENLWPEGHPYHHLTIGSHEDLAQASLDDVKGFFRTWYTPNNASLVVAGDFDPAQAKAEIQRQFGGIPRGPEAVHATTAPAALAQDVVVEEYDDVPHQRVWMAWISPALYAPGDAELDLLSSVLTGGKDARLSRALVQEQQVAQDVSAYQASSSLGSMYVIEATAAEGHDTAEVVAAVEAILAKVWADEPPTDDELMGARNNYERGFYQRLTTVSQKADQLNGYLSLTNDPGYAQADLQRYLDASSADVVRFGQQVLSQPHVELHIRPNADEPTPTEAPATEGGE